MTASPRYFEIGPDPMPEELYASPIARAAIDSQHYVMRKIYLDAVGGVEEAEYLESSACIDFAAAVTMHASAFMGPNDVREVAEPMITSCQSQIERAIEAYEVQGDNLHSHRQGELTTLYAWRYFLPHLLLFKTMCLYPPENDEAAGIRQELAQNAYDLSARDIPRSFAVYEASKRNENLGDKAKERPSGPLQESALLSLVNRTNDPNCLALPVTDMDDGRRKLDAAIITYEPTGSFIRYAQVKASKTRHMYKYPFQAVVHAIILGNGDWGKGLVKTWNTTHAIMAEQSGIYPAEGAIEGITQPLDTPEAVDRYLSDQRTIVMEYITSNAREFLHSFWRDPSEKYELPDAQPAESPE